MQSYVLNKCMCYSVSFKLTDIYNLSLFALIMYCSGIDQTRGWFYTLLVLSTALFNKPPFKNLIANGLVLASDGEKMSKRKKNYPDPLEIVHKYGADALRYGSSFHILKLYPHCLD